MKKYLLGALFILGTLSYAQGNKVIVPVTAAGDATATMPIEVTGQVFDKSTKSLVVDIVSAASPEGTGFAFRMPDLFATETDVQRTAEGRFRAQILENDIPEAFAAAPAVELVKNGSGASTQTGTVSGTASDVTLKYTVAGLLNTAETEYNGSITVAANAGTKKGTYSDTSVSLKIEVNGQA